MLNSGNSTARIFTKGKPTRVFPFFVFAAFLLWTSVAQAQIHEIGASLGATNYVGDLVRTYQLNNHRPAGALFYRYNLNDYSSLRANVLLGKLVGSDDKPYDPFAGKRNREQFDNWLNELSVMYEYNFLDYKNPDKNIVRWTPYFVGGIGIMLQHGYDSYRKGTSPGIAYSSDRKTANFKNYQPVIPLGVGVKYLLNPNWTIGAEWVARKTFFDYLDNTGDIADGFRVKNYQYGNKKHNDWFFFTGLTLSYTFWSIPCPYHFNPKKYL